MTKDEKNLQKLKDSLSKVPRDANIVIYCGCCPFEHCPNVRPAICIVERNEIYQLSFTQFAAQY